ncbi:MAG: hypothetical protein M9965_14395 [Anaerolineae bacterium]|nr:hypothetical protein [Anaerolineae bacterium]
MSTIRVATFNVHRRLDRWQLRREVLLSALLDVNPDLVALQELSIVARQGQWLCKQLNLRLSGQSHAPYKLVQRSGRHPLWGLVEGVGVLTKLPVISADAQMLGQDGRMALRINTVLSNGKSLDFVSVQLNPTPGAHETREKQIMRLLGWLNGPGAVAYQIVAGSYEDVPGQLALRRIQQFYRYRSAHAATNGHEPAATFPTALVATPHRVGECRDYIFLSSASGKAFRSGLFGLASAVEDDTLYPSDHVGVWAEVEI